MCRNRADESPAGGPVIRRLILFLAASLVHYGFACRVMGWTFRARSQRRGLGRFLDRTGAAGEEDAIYNRAVPRCACVAGWLQSALSLVGGDAVRGDVCGVSRMTHFLDFPRFCKIRCREETKSGQDPLEG